MLRCCLCTVGQLVHTLPEGPLVCGVTCLYVDHSLIVTCCRVRKIKESSPRGDILRDVTLPGDVINPLHTIQLTSGQFIVCHCIEVCVVSGDPIHRVCNVSEDGVK